MNAHMLTRRECLLLGAVGGVGTLSALVVLAYMASKMLNLIDRAEQRMLKDFDR